MLRRVSSARKFKLNLGRKLRLRNKFKGCGNAQFSVKTLVGFLLSVKGKCAWPMRSLYKTVVAKTVERQDMNPIVVCSNLDCKLRAPFPFKIATFS